MTHNSLYPGFVKMKYSALGHIHYQTLPVKVEDHGAGEEPTFVLRNGSDVVAMNTAIAAYVALIDNFYNTADSFILAEYWHVPVINEPPVFEYAYEIGEIGVSGSGDVPNSQMCISFRTEYGGILKLYLMEQVLATNLKDDYPFSNAAVAALAAYLCASATGWVIGRDGGYPISPLRMLTKVNDALRKKYVLNV